MGYCSPILVGLGSSISNIVKPISPVSWMSSTVEAIVKGMRLPSSIKPKVPIILAATLKNELLGEGIMLSYASKRSREL